MRDIVFAFRQLLKNRGFTAVVVLTLALGIGANTAVFSLVNDVLLRTLPVRNPGELVLFRNIEGRGGRLSRAGENNGSIDPVTGRSASTSFSLLQFERFHDYHPALETVFAFAPINRLNVLIDGQPETITLGQLVSGDYYAGLGVSALIGRTLTPEDDLPGAPTVAVISYRYWGTRFERNPDVIGKTIQVNRVPVTLIGVTPAGFAGAMQVGESADITLALAQHTRIQSDRAATRAQPWYWWIRIMGRLAPASTAAQAAASLEPAFQQAAREGWQAGRELDTGVRSDAPEPPTLIADPGEYGENDRRRDYAQSLRVLMGLAGLVLLAACANVANLLIVRGAARRREIGVRLALGASRARIVRQLLAECLLLACAGAAVGALFAYWTRGLLVGLRQFGGTPAVLNLPLDARVLGFTIATSLATSIVFGLLPSVRATRLDLGAELQSGCRLLGDAGRTRLGQSLMIVQIALSLVLLVTAGLFIHTLRNLQNVDPGFNSRGLVLFRIEAGSSGHTAKEFVSFHERLRQRLEHVPGVGAATFARVALLAQVRSNRRISVPGYTPAPGETMIFNVNGIAPNFLAAMEIPLVLGRAFEAGDTTDAPRVAIVSQAFSRKLFGESSPIGRILRFSGWKPTEAPSDVTIVAVARDAKYTGVREANPATIYVPAAQMLEGTANYYVRLIGTTASVGPAIRAAVREIDPTLPIIDLHTQEAQMERLTSQERLFARLCGVFGLLTVILSSVGLYGLMSFMVLRRTGEIGLRMALGALPGQVRRMILREALALVGFGVVLGVTATLGAGRFVASLLFDLSPRDPLTYSSVVVLLVVVATAASLLPARRAAHVDPITALRAE
jgi:predicted permease